MGAAVNLDLRLIWQSFRDYVIEFSTAIGVVSVTLVGAAILHAVVFSVVRRFSHRSRWTIDEAILKKVRRPSRVLFVLLAVQAVTYSPTRIPPDALEVIRHIVIVCVILVSVQIALKSFRAIDEQIRRRHRTDVRDNYMARRIHTQASILRRSASVFVITIGAALVLMTFPRARELGASVLASAGLAGLVIGLAARPVFENLIAGIQIALTQPINLDDVVIVEGEWGWIEEISSTYVVVRIWDQRRLIVPLTYFIQHPFQNWTRRSADILGTVFLYADYSLPVQKVREKLEEIVAASELWDGRVCVLQVTDSRERTMELRALVSAADSPTAWDLRVQVREKLIEYLQKEFPEALPRTRVELHRNDRASDLEF